MIRFSVVIPLYNKEKEIVDTLNSVLKQSHVVDEIIVVDDGSTDRSILLIHQNFKEKITVIFQKNMGVSTARNRGIIEAKNEYICLLDADDLWEENFLEEISSLIGLYPKATFFSTAHKYMDENGNFLKSKIKFDKEYRGEIGNFIEVFRTNYGLVNSSSVCIRKSSNIIFPLGEKKGEDICVWLELGLKGSLAFSAKALSLYKLDASNRSSTIHQEAIVPCPLKWFYKNKEQLKQEKNYKSIRKFIYSNIFITVYGGFALSANYVSIDAVIRLMKKNSDRFYFLLYPAYLMPIGFLDFIKKIRRKMR